MNKRIMDVSGIPRNMIIFTDDFTIKLEVSTPCSNYLIRVIFENPILE